MTTSIEHLPCATCYLTPRVCCHGSHFTDTEFQGSAYYYIHLAVCFLKPFSAGSKEVQHWNWELKWISGCSVNVTDLSYSSACGILRKSGSQGKMVQHCVSMSYCTLTGYKIGSRTCGQSSYRNLSRPGHPSLTWRWVLTNEAEWATCSWAASLFPMEFWFWLSPGFDNRTKLTKQTSKQKICLLDFSTCV